MRRAGPLILLLCAWPAFAAGPVAPPVAAVATAHPLATEAAHAILRKGGNAFDAAVAAAATLAVVEPYGSGLGGGGFFLLHRARDGHTVMVDGRERAPLAARHDMYLDDEGKVIPRASLDGPLAAAIPGSPAALVHIASKYGRLPLAESLAPAIRIAREGFSVSSHYRERARRRFGALVDYPTAGEIFLADGEPPEKGFVLRQPDLAATLARLAEQGHDGFYRGEIARKLVDGVRAAEGIWSLEDLAQYQVVERAPVRIDYRGVRVTTAALPSSGGLVLAQILKTLESRDLVRMLALERVDAVVAAMRAGYRLRTTLGDPDQGKDPATANTTHFSILDRAGNRVAATLSLNTLFGSGFVAPGTGVLLNNEMDDFVARPGAPNAYGLIGDAANAIAPGRRPLSSMTPTFLETDHALAILGTPGGSRIISMVLLAALEFSAGERDPARLVANPRYHHQDVPAHLDLEPGTFSDRERDVLTARGHDLHVLDESFGNMQAIVWERYTGVVRAASDPRGEGAATTDQMAARKPAAGAP